MRLCDNPFTIPTIDIDECIGTSLATINTNVQELKNELCLNSNELAEIKISLDSLHTNINNLSALSPGIAKAYVIFDGTRDINGNYTKNGNRYLYNNFGIASVSSNKTGTYSLSFTTAFPNISYALIGTSMETASGGNYTWLQPTTFATTSASINIHSYLDNTVSLADAEYISVLIYNT
jgi:hypothetical protein